jgi:hypothetical protein
VYETLSERLLTTAFNLFFWVESFFSANLNDFSKVMMISCGFEKEKGEEE